MFREITFAAVAAVVVLVAGWIFSRRSRVLTPERAIRFMYTDPLAGLDVYLNAKSFKVRSRIFNETTGGLRGTWRRWQNANGYLRICEYAVMHGMATDRDLVKVRCFRSTLALSSLLSIAETFLGRWSENIIAAHGLNALQDYWSITKTIHDFSVEAGFVVGNVSLERFLG